MSHEIYKVNGKDSMAYTNETPWHGLGQKLTENAPIEIWQNEAGLNWQAEERSMYYTDMHNNEQKVPNKKLLTRDDNGKALSIVGSGYKTVQPKEVIEFFRSLVETNDFNLHTAGSLKQGRVIWALADIKKGFTLTNKDQVNGYLLLSTSLDQSMATRAQFTTVRVVCNNTLSMAINRNDKSAVKVNHSQVFNPEQVKTQLGLGRKMMTEFKTQATKMRKTTMNRKQAIEYFTKVLCPEIKQLEDKKEEIPESKIKTFEKRISKVVDIYDNAPGQKEAGETTWGALNAVSYYTDHAVGERQPGNRLQKAWFGQGATMKQTALEAAIEATEQAMTKTKTKTKTKPTEQSLLINSIADATVKYMKDKEAGILKTVARSGPGVIASIFEIIQNSGPVDQTAISTKLAERFPDRDPVAMDKTIRAQIGGKKDITRMEKEKGIKFVIKDKKYSLTA